MWSVKRKIWSLMVVLAGAALLTLRAAEPSPPVFPGAQGFGTETRAAYGGSNSPTLYRVTNLNNSGSGSLRAALEASGPRIVVFELSGTITLSNDIYIKNPYVTMAGQTAPSPGITLKDYGIVVDNAHDVLIQHLRVRPGDTAGLAGYWGVGIMNGAYNVVIDHVSVSWAIDESFTAYPWTLGAPRDVTISNSIISEGLVTPINGGVSSGHGALICAKVERVTMHRNVLAHNTVRNPFICGGAKVAVTNNIFYDFLQGSYVEAIPPNGVGIPALAAFVSNVYIAGPSVGLLKKPTPYVLHLDESTPAGSQIYRSDNLIVGTLHPLLNEASASVLASSSPVTMPTGLLRAAQVEASVLSGAGARPTDRDAVDTRVIQQVTGRTGKYVTSQNNIGGWPTLAVNRRTLTLPSDPHAVTSSGYTNLELWLHTFSTALQKGGSVPLTPTGLRVVGN